jgi:transcriptional regulator with XRE-family HTH domain
MHAGRSEVPNNLQPYMVLTASKNLSYADKRISVFSRGIMTDTDQTFGRAISQARKKLGWSQKELASKILREDEEPISPQYLNDIEHDRRSPSSDRMVQQFADVLTIQTDWLYYLAGRFPADLRERKLSEREVTNLMVAFRGNPKRK